jgi:hypothetical protein
MKAVFLTSYYKGEQYLRRYCFCAAYLLKALRAGGFDPLFAVAVNAASQKEKKLWESSALRLPICPVFCERETVYASWNRLLSLHSEADVFLVWNMDDWRWPGGTLDQVRMLSREGAAVAVNAFQEWKWSKWPFHFQWKGRCAPGLHSPSPFLAFNRAALQKTGPFLHSFFISGDKEWYYRAQRRGVPVRMSEVAAGVLYNVGAGLSTSGDAKRICENLVIQELYPEYNKLHYPFYEKQKEAIVRQLQMLK